MIAIVTGAAQGLGLAFANAMRDRGDVVVTCDVQDGCDEIVDVSQPWATKAFVDAVVARHGRVDVLVANAGQCRVTNALDSFDAAVADYEALVGTNLGGVYWAGRAVAPHMSANGSGHIVIISTDHVLPTPGRPTGGGAHMDVYDASKWALRGLVEAWSKSLARHGVRVNALCMGATDSPMLRAFTGDRLTPEIEASWMRPEQIAEVLLALVDEGDGGRTGEHIGLWVGHPVVLPER